MGFNQISILPDKSIKIFLWTNEKEFKTDVIRNVVNNSSFIYDDISALVKTIDSLEFEDNKDYSIFGYIFMTKKSV